MDARLTHSEEVQVALGHPWVLTFKSIGAAVDRVKAKELQEEQHSSGLRSSSPSPAKVTKRASALLHDTGESGDQERAPSPYGGSNPNSRDGRSNYQSRPHDRGRSPHRSLSRDTKDSMREQDIRCAACDCWHYEPMGHGRCPFRPTTSAGTARLVDHKGWDTKFMASLASKTKIAMSYRVRAVTQGHPAALSEEERESIFAKINTPLGNAGNRRTSK